MSVSTIAFIGSLAGRNELIRDGAGHPARLRPGQRPGQMGCPMPVARKMLLQLAARNIGQLTDIEPFLLAGAHRGTPAGRSFTGFPPPRPARSPRGHRGMGDDRAVAELGLASEPATARPGHRRMTGILVVEDQAELQRALQINLRARLYDVMAARSGRQALALAASRGPDAVILDLGLPDIDGIEVIMELRRWYRPPIIVLSGRISPGDKIGALDAGADDYVTKPFAMGELLARLRAALRRDEGNVAHD
jgi:CheY-like chemotaxis protein